MAIVNAQNPTPMHVAEVIVSRRQIARRLRALAGEINARYGHDELTLLGVLTGSMVFLADLMRRLAMPVRVETIGVSSYPGPCCQPTGQPEVSAPLGAHMGGRHVLIVDDILDTGSTLQSLIDLLRGQGPLSLATCVLLRKPAGPDASRPEVDFVGFDIPSRFVVGYGLDYDGLHRNLGDVCALSSNPAPPAAPRPRSPRRARA